MDKDINVMVDIETLGLGDEAQIIQISATHFSFRKGSSHHKFNGELDFNSIKDRNGDIKINLDTLNFWLKDINNYQVFKNFCEDKKGRVPEYFLINAFHKYLTNLKGEEKFSGELQLWGNGVIFDNVKIENLFNKHGLKSPIKYSRHMDVRTLMALASDVTGKTIDELRDPFKEGKELHNAQDDVEYQVEYLVNAYNLIMEEN